MKIIAMIAALCAAPAFGQDMYCAQRGIVMDNLEQLFGEVSIGYGHEYRGAVIEVYVSRYATWTLVITRPDGISCELAGGTDWVFIEQPWPNLDEEG